MSKLKIASIGGGPAGLYFGILAKKSLPDAEVTIFERNRHDDTFGWGVVFSDATLENIEEADPESFARIRDSFIYWRDIDTYYQDQCVRSTGHGFCGMSRKKLLMILQDRCRELGAELHFETEIDDIDRVKNDYDLVLGADGIASKVRDRWSDVFQPSLDWRRCKFAWFGTDKELEAFTFVFVESEWGVFQVHAYPFEPGLGTWIVECEEEVWRRAGLHELDEADSAAFCEELFAPWLDGNKLLINRSIWRTFPTVRCKQWHHDNVVLLGDAVHTAHFSIGSGTKLAMEDAIALRDVIVEHGADDIPRALAAYQDERDVPAAKLQKSAQTSLEWFENSARYMDQDPLIFTFNLMSRSKQITWDNLSVRDPELMRRVRRQVAAERGAFDGDVHAIAGASDAGQEAIAEPPVPIFLPLRLRDCFLENRIVVSPMCQYSAQDGLVGDWHLVHLASRALGGAGLVMTEMTDVCADGRITPGCAGLWNGEQRDAWARIVDFVHTQTASRIGVQLAHAGRKGSCRHPWSGDDVPLEGPAAWPLIAPSAIPLKEGWPTPKEMDRSDMDAVRDAFVLSTELAFEAGFDLVELHMAHGYLLSSFLSPLTNRRSDEYGGDLQGRMRFPLEVFRAVREAWPQSRPLAVRISASDWLDDEGGQTIDESVEIARELAALGCDVIDVSSAGNVPESQPIYGRMYQVPFAERIRQEVDITVMAVGAILDEDHANTVIAAGRADLCAIARAHLRRPYLTLQASDKYEHAAQSWARPVLDGPDLAPRGPEPTLLVGLLDGLDPLGGDGLLDRDHLGRLAACPGRHFFALELGFEAIEEALGLTRELVLPGLCDRLFRELFVTVRVSRLSGSNPKGASLGCARNATVRDHVEHGLVPLLEAVLVLLEVLLARHAALEARGLAHRIKLEAREQAAKATLLLLVEPELDALDLGFGKADLSELHAGKEQIGRGAFLTGSDALLGLGVGLDATERLREARNGSRPLMLGEEFARRVDVEDRRKRVAAVGPEQTVILTVGDPRRDVAKEHDLVAERAGEALFGEQTVLQSAARRSRRVRAREVAEDHLPGLLGASLGLAEVSDPVRVFEEG